MLPLVGSQSAEWPALAPGPLDDGTLWEYVVRGQLADLGPLLPGVVDLAGGRGQHLLGV